LRDEILSHYRKMHLSSKPIDLNEDLSQDKSYLELNSDQIIQSVEKASNLIKSRLEELTHYDPNERSKISQIIQKSMSYDFLAHMDPNFFPHF
jgi:hypothetical protein